MMPLVFSGVAAKAPVVGTAAGGVGRRGGTRSILRGCGVGGSAVDTPRPARIGPRGTHDDAEPRPYHAARVNNKLF